MVFSLIKKKICDIKPTQIHRSKSAALRVLPTSECEKGGTTWGTSVFLYLHFSGVPGENWFMCFCPASLQEAKYSAELNFQSSSICKAMAFHQIGLEQFYPF